MVYTSIQIMPETRMKLAKLKESERDTYDSVLTRLLELVPAEDEEGEYTEEFRVSLLKARLDLKRGRTIPHEILKSRLGL